MNSPGASEYSNGHRAGITGRSPRYAPLVTSAPGDSGPRLVLSSRPASGILHLSLNQPERRNALTAQLAQALRQELSLVTNDSSVRVLILTGSGTAFCAGADLGSLGAGAPALASRRRDLGDYYRAFLDLRDLAIPTIAAINGPAIGAGLNLALCCDLRIVSEDARLAAPFVRLGIHPGGGATWMLTHLVGPGAAKEILLLGQPLDAGRALQLGLASRLVPSDQLQEAALDWALSLAALPAPVLRNLKHTLALAEGGASLSEVLDFETGAQAEALASEDAREGWSAVQEHREPHFRDR